MHLSSYFLTRRGTLKIATRYSEIKNTKGELRPSYLKQLIIFDGMYTLIGMFLSVFWTSFGHHIMLHRQELQNCVDRNLFGHICKCLTMRVSTLYNDFIRGVYLDYMCRKLYFCTRQTVYLKYSLGNNVVAKRRPALFPHSLFINLERSLTSCVSQNILLM